MRPLRASLIARYFPCETHRVSNGSPAAIRSTASSVPEYVKARSRPVALRMSAFSPASTSLSSEPARRVNRLPCRLSAVSGGDDAPLHAASSGTAKTAMSAINRLFIGVSSQRDGTGRAGGRLRNGFRRRLLAIHSLFSLGKNTLENRNVLAH